MNAENIKLFLSSHSKPTIKMILSLGFVPTLFVAIDVLFWVFENNLQIPLPLSLIPWCLYLIWGFTIISKVDKGQWLPVQIKDYLLGNSCGLTAFAIVAIILNFLIQEEIFLLLLGILIIIVMTGVGGVVFIARINRRIRSIANNVALKKQRAAIAARNTPIIMLGILVGTFAVRTFFTHIPDEISRSPLFYAGIFMLLYCPFIVGAVTGYYRVYLGYRFKVGSCGNS